MRAGRGLGICKMQNDRVGLLSMNAVIHARKICRRTTAGLGHHAKLVAARINLERIDRTVLDGLVTNRDMHGHAHDAVALAELRCHIRPRLNHDYVLAHSYHDPSRHWLFNMWRTSAILLQNCPQAPKRRRPLCTTKDSVSLEKLRAELRFYTVYNNVLLTPQTVAIRDKR